MILSALSSVWFHKEGSAHPPQPVLAFLLGLFLTLKNSIKHCLSRIMLGMLMINGTI